MTDVYGNVSGECSPYGEFDPYEVEGQNAYYKGFKNANDGDFHAEDVHRQQFCEEVESDEDIDCIPPKANCINLSILFRINLGVRL